MCVVFFFQAEDGIRDYKVTGVQTCALPISLKIIFHHSPKEHLDNVVVVVPSISTHQILMNVKRTQMTVISTPHVTIMMEASAVSVSQVCQAMEPHAQVCAQL